LLCLTCARKERASTALTKVRQPVAMPAQAVAATAVSLALARDERLIAYNILILWEREQVLSRGMITQGDSIV